MTLRLSLVNTNSSTVQQMALILCIFILSFSLSSLMIMFNRRMRCVNVLFRYVVASISTATSTGESVDQSDVRSTGRVTVLHAGETAVFS